MRKEQLKKLFDRVREQDLSVEDALEQLQSLPFDDLGHSRVDTHRDVRCGFPEVIFCEGKTSDEIRDIAGAILDSDQNLLATRADRETYDTIESLDDSATYHERAGCVTVTRTEPEPLPGSIGIISAGTSDAHAAEEARVTAESFGAGVTTVEDAGVAGLHRLLPDREALRKATVLIVAAGMEGALPSVVGGLVDKPVIGVPTSTGYGTAFGGVTALLGMLNSCTPAVVPVNVDNGYGAAYFACQILRTRTDDS